MPKEQAGVSSHDPLVNFMIIGAMKCGTSTLASIIARHPEVCFSTKKEPSFFNKYKNWESHLAEYHQYFKAKNLPVVAEGSVVYTTLPHLKIAVSKSIYQYNPGMKLLYIIRHPLERYLSHYLHLYQKGKTNVSLEESIEKLPQLTHYGRYAYQLKPYFESFEREQIMATTLERFQEDKIAVLHEIARFLRITPQLFTEFEQVHLNASIGQNITPQQFDKWVHAPRLKWVKKFAPATWARKILVNIAGNQQRVYSQKPELPISIKKKLAAIYLPDLVELEELAGLDCTPWKEELIQYLE